MLYSGLPLLISKAASCFHCSSDLRLRQWFPRWKRKGNAEAQLTTCICCTKPRHCMLLIMNYFSTGLEPTFVVFRCSSNLGSGVIICDAA